MEHRREELREGEEYLNTVLHSNSCWLDYSGFSRSQHPVCFYILATWAY